MPKRTRDSLQDLDEMMREMTIESGKKKKVAGAPDSSVVVANNDSKHVTFGQVRCLCKFFLAQINCLKDEIEMLKTKVSVQDVGCSIQARKG